MDMAACEGGFQRHAWRGTVVRLWSCVVLAFSFLSFRYHVLLSITVFATNGYSTHTQESKLILVDFERLHLSLLRCTCHLSFINTSLCRASCPWFDMLPIWLAECSSGSEAHFQRDFSSAPADTSFHPGACWIYPLPPPFHSLPRQFPPPPPPRALVIRCYVYFCSLPATSSHCCTQ